MNKRKIHTQAEIIKASGEHCPEKSPDLSAAGHHAGCEIAEKLSEHCTCGIDDTWEHVSAPVVRIVARVASQQTPRRRAVRQLEREGHHGRAEHAADVVLTAIAEPDREMIAAGALELESALPKEATAGYRRSLALVIWRAMFARVRQ